MELRLYMNQSDNRYVTKYLTNETITDCLLKEPTDLLNPVIRFQGTAQNYNYAYIPYLNRYYFINSVTMLPGNVSELILSCDVLMTYASQIRSLTGCVERQEFKRNAKIVDSELIAQVNNNFICRTVGDAVNSDYNIYITTCGGA